MHPNIFGCTPCITKIYRNLILKQTDWDRSSYRTIFIEPLDSQILLHKKGISKYSLGKGQQLLTEYNQAGIISGSPHSQHSASLLSVYWIPSTPGMTRRWKHCKSKPGTIFSNCRCCDYLHIYTLKSSTNTCSKPYLCEMGARFRILIL